jgi:hypothetical protein
MIHAKPGVYVPLVLQHGSHRFFMTLGDCCEPPHVHVKQGKQKAKFWLDPVELARAGRFKAHELVDIERLVIENRDGFYEKWEELCGGSE